MSRVEAACRPHPSGSLCSAGLQQLLWEVTVVKNGGLCVVSCTVYTSCEDEDDLFAEQRFAERTDIAACSGWKA